MSLNKKETQLISQHIPSISSALLGLYRHAEDGVEAKPSHKEEQSEEAQYRTYLLTDMLLDVITIDSPVDRREEELAVDETTAEFIKEIVDQGMHDDLSQAEFMELALALTQSFATALDSEEYLRLTPESIEEMSDEEYQKTILEIAQSILDALSNQTKLPEKVMATLRRLSMILILCMLGALLVTACTTEPEPTINEQVSTSLNPDEGDDNTSGSGGNPPDDEKLTTPVPTLAPIATATLAPTNTPEPDPSPTPSIPGAESNETIANDEVLRQYHAKFIEFFFPDQQFIGDLDTNIAWEPFITVEGSFLLARIVDGSITYKGERYSEGTHLRFASLTSEEPYFASVEYVQGLLIAAGIIGTVVDITIDLVTSQTIAVDADGNILAQVDLETSEWEINPALLEVKLPPATVATLLTDTTDLTQDQSRVLRYLVYPNGSQSPDVAAYGPLQIPFADENMSWEQIAQKLDSATVFYENMRSSTGFDVEAATRAWKEAPKGWIELAVKYLGTYRVDFGEYGINTYLLFQTWIEDNGQAIPVVFAVFATDPTMLSNFYYLNDSHEVKSNVPQSAGSIIGSLERVEPHMILRVATGLPKDAGNPLTYGLFTPDDLLPEHASFDSASDILGTSVISAPAVGAILATPKQQ